MSRKARRASQHGYTFVEIAVVAAIMAIGFAAFGQVFGSSDGLVDGSRSHLRAHEDLRRNLEAVANALRGADIDTLGGFDPDGRATVPTFQRVTGADALGRTYDPVEELRWEGVDRKVNGIESPGRVVRIQDGVETLVADRVPKDGFAVTLEGNTLVVQLSTYASTADRRIVTVTGSTAISLRN
jgi:hypothetical protein